MGVDNEQLPPAAADHKSHSCAASTSHSCSPAAVAAQHTGATSHKQDLYEYLHNKRKQQKGHGHGVVSSGNKHSDPQAAAAKAHNRRRTSSERKHPSKPSIAFVNPLIDLQVDSAADSTESASERHDDALLDLIDSGSEHLPGMSSGREKAHRRQHQVQNAPVAKQDAAKENIAPHEADTRRHIRRDKEHIRAMKHVAKWIRQQQQRGEAGVLTGDMSSARAPVVGDDSRTMVVKHEHHHYYHFHHYYET